MARRQASAHRVFERMFFKEPDRFAEHGRRLFLITRFYFFLLLIFRIAGKRTFAQITPFDLVLLLVVGEATQQGLIGDDFSVTKALLLITSLVGIDIGLSYLQRHLPVLDRAVEGRPLVILEDGKTKGDRLKKARVDEADILEAARKLHGLERLEQLKYAVLERDGSISVVPKAEAAWRATPASQRA